MDVAGQDFFSSPARLRMVRRPVFHVDKARRDRTLSQVLLQWLGWSISRHLSHLYFIVPLLREKKS